MSNVVFIHGKLKERKFDESIELIRIKLMSIENLGEVWPNWDQAFEEAVEYEAKFGSEKALEIFKCLCPFDLEGK